MADQKKIGFWKMLGKVGELSILLPVLAAQWPVAKKSLRRTKLPPEVAAFDATLTKVCELVGI